MALSAWAISAVLLAAGIGLHGCTEVSTSLTNLPCDTWGRCSAEQGYVCNTHTWRCVLMAPYECNGDPSVLCPDTVQTGEPCGYPGRVIPCSGSEPDCAAGCRTCGESFTWGACSQAPSSQEPATGGLDPLDTSDDGDSDSDGDGYSDADEATCGSSPTDAADRPMDTDGDGVCDHVDADDDNDGVPDDAELGAGTDPLDEHACGDADNDTCDDCAVTGDLADDGPDADPSNDGVDTDTDGTCDATDPDDDGDGWSDTDETACGTDPVSALSFPGDADSDGICDSADDCEGDNGTGDTDGDSLCDDRDDDDDDDAWTDAEEEACGTDSKNPARLPVDSNDDGVCDALIAVADTYVSEYRPRESYGQERKLRCVLGSSKTKHALFKFEMPFPLEGLRSARLLLHAAGELSSTQQGPTVHVTSSDWDEMSVTWETRPAPQEPAVAVIAEVVGEGWFEVDVTGAITVGTISLVLLPQSEDSLYVFSRDHGWEPGSKAPRVVLDY